MSLTRLLVAVVDDEESVRKALGRLIRSSGLDVRTFSSGIAFLESLSTCVPDCVVLDLHMPCMSGFEVQERLAKAASRVRVIILTAHDTDEYRERAMKAGAAAFLRKPVADQLLLDTIRTAASDFAGNGGSKRQ